MACLNLGDHFSYRGNTFRAMRLGMLRKVDLAGDGEMRAILIGEGQDPDQAYEVIATTADQATVVFGQGVESCFVAIREVTILDRATEVVEDPRLGLPILSSFYRYTIDRLRTSLGER